MKWNIRVKKLQPFKKGVKFSPCPHPNLGLQADNRRNRRFMCNLDWILNSFELYKWKQCVETFQSTGRKFIIREYWVECNRIATFMFTCINFTLLPISRLVDKWLTTQNSRIEMSLVLPNFFLCMKKWRAFALCILEKAF